MAVNSQTGLVPGNQTPIRGLILTTHMVSGSFVRCFTGVHGRLVQKHGESGMDLPPSPQHSRAVTHATSEAAAFSLRVR